MEKNYNKTNETRDIKPEKTILDLLEQFCMEQGVENSCSVCRAHKPHHNIDE